MACSRPDASHGHAVPTSAGGRPSLMVALGERPPRKKSGRLMGKDHWPGAAYTEARGKAREKGPR